MNVKLFLQNKYNRDIDLSELHGSSLEITTVNHGTVKGIYQYAGLHYNKDTDEYEEPNIVILNNIESEILSRAYFTPQLLTSRTFHFLPDDIIDICIL